MRFEFATSTRIIFGSGTISEAIPAAKALGKRVLVALNSLDYSAYLLEQLNRAELSPLPYPISGEPTIASVLGCLQVARDAKCDLVIGIGVEVPWILGKPLQLYLPNPP